MDSLPENDPPSDRTIVSRRLGPLHFDAIDAVLERNGLGRVLEASPAPGGLFGQNLLIRSTTGWLVLRGAPHAQWQFPKECFAIRELHRRCAVPVAHPCVHDIDPDPLGWPCILMPRLPGIHPFDAVREPGDAAIIARAIGANLAEMHRSEWTQAGSYDIATDAIVPFPCGYADWMEQDLESWMAAAGGARATFTNEDRAWVRSFFAAARPFFEEGPTPAFTMHDHNPGNLLVEPGGEGWRVSGVFDFMEFHVGDPDLDLARMSVALLEMPRGGGPKPVAEFQLAYRARRPARAGLRERLAFHLVRDRLVVWEYATRPDVGWVHGPASFRTATEPLLAVSLPDAPVG